MDRPIPISVERLNLGEPVLSPTGNWWETGVTFNASAVYLERSIVNDPIIRRLLPMIRLDDPVLQDGIVVVHYRARAEHDPVIDFGRSFLGLAIFTPQMELVYRYQEPVLLPSADLRGFDYLGVEDPRITRLGDIFYMVYCGVSLLESGTWQARLCLAVSTDLLHWEKHGIMPGDPADFQNKDGVLFPECIDGHYYLLHRPYQAGMDQAELAIHLAESVSLSGPWRNCGEVLRAYPNPRFVTSWVGAGSVPVKVGERRFLEIYHTGNYLNQSDREYDLDAAIFNFDAFNPQHPSSLVTSRLEHFMVPETPAELRSRSRLQVGNVLFACGSYVYNGYLYIIYGGADTYTLAARVKLDTLVKGVEQAGLVNPFLK